jgi:iron complex outermembrane recepter protein
MEQSLRLAAVISAIALAAPLHAQEAAPAEQRPFSMEEVVVTGTASRERTKFESSVGISTFNSEEIAQQAPKSTAELLSAVPGFWVESTSGTTQGNVFARGIIQDGGYRYVGLMEDGIPIYPVFELSFYNPDQFVRVDETIERVEAVRGGTAPIFTAGAVGGTVNFVTKSPGETSEAIAKLSVSDYGLYGGELSWTAPINDRWGMLFGGYYRQSNGIRDPGYKADKGGQVRLKLVRSFSSGELEFFAKYLNDHSLFVVPIPLRGDPSNPDGAAGGDPGTYSLHSSDLAAAGLPESAAEVNLQDSDLEDGIHPDLFTAGARLTWDLSPTFTITDALRYTDGNVRFDGIFPGAAAVTGIEFADNAGIAPDYTVLATGAAYDPTQLVQNHGHWVVNKDYRALQNDLRLGMLLGPHDLTLGAYYADYSMADRWSLGNLLLMDLADRPHRLLLPGVTDPRGFTLYSFFNLIANYDAKQWAVYLSDEWQVTDRLRIDLGARYDSENIDASISNGEFGVDLDGDPATTYDISALAGSARTRSSPDFDYTTWSAGFNFELTDHQAIFGHYTNSAKLPHFDDVRNGVLQEDEVTDAVVGYKISFQPIALFATLFQTEFDNVPFNDILADGSIIVRKAQTRTRGIELEGVWEPIDVLSVNFSITQQEPEYRDFTGAEVDNTGNQIRRIPKTMIRLTPTFSFASYRGRVYATWQHVGKRYSNDENTIVLPEYDKFDAGVIYDFTDALTLQLKVDNLTDEVGLTEGNPRTDVGASGIGAVYNARPLFGRSWELNGTVRF